MSDQDKRRHFRKSLQAKATIADILGNTWTSIDMLDISSSGAAFMSEEALPPGSARMVRFQLPDSDKRYTVVCKIVHCTEHSFLRGYRVGSEFVRAGEEELRAIARFVNDQGG